MGTCQEKKYKYVVEVSCMHSVICYIISGIRSLCSVFERGQKKWYHAICTRSHISLPVKSFGFSWILNCLVKLVYRFYP
jgi:hypothetical protein